MCAWSKLFIAALALVGAITGTLDAGLAQSVRAVTDIGPKKSNHPFSPNAASGGRVNKLGVDPGNRQVMYAASEWGGLWKSTDAGETWSHLPGHVPQATWDVKVDPTNSQRVYATSLFDGKTQSIAGISVSTDGGVTWRRPASAVQPASFDCNIPEDREQPHAFGIAIDPERPSRVAIGTNCGLALSDDHGATWRYVWPRVETGPLNSNGATRYIWSVIIHHGGIIDVCGDDGHFRSTNGGATWVAPVADTGAPLPAGQCTLAVSPDEPNVLFATVGTDLLESTDGGRNWLWNYDNPKPQGRVPFVSTNKRDGRRYDLWLGDTSLYRRSCETPAATVPAKTPRCGEGNDKWQPPILGYDSSGQAFHPGYTSAYGAHDDMGDIVFDGPGPSACPYAISTDGGIYLNTKRTSPDCHAPQWKQPQRTPRALWNFEMAGVKDPVTGNVSLYFGNQDNGTFGTRDAGAANPAWTNDDCCDGFGIAADRKRVLTTICCHRLPSGGVASRLLLNTPDMQGSTEVDTTAIGGNAALRRWDQLDSIQSFGADSYVIATYTGVFVTKNISAPSPTWTRLGSAGPAASAPKPVDACAIQVSYDGSTPVFYALGRDPSGINPDADWQYEQVSKVCNGEHARFLWRYRGTAANGTWQRITRPDGGWFGVYAVDPNDPDRIVAAEIGNEEGEMVITSDGGRSWRNLPALEKRMTGDGRFLWYPILGPTRFLTFNSYAQPTLLAFEPGSPNVMVAGAADAGLFLSIDGGTTWKLLTDPFTPGATGVPHVPRPRYVYFDRRGPDALRLFVGTMGRGVWRFDLDGVPGSQRIELSSSLLFDSGRADLKPAASMELGRAAEAIRRAGDAVAFVEGHTDSRGSEAANQRLSEERAEAVAEWLVAQGRVPATQLSVRGYGEERPIAGNDTEAGRARNRRVEIRVVPAGTVASAPR